ncbi:MAG: damage-inducible protein DinB, partial [Methylobacterium sp.]|nr:damage-inducible protein DinB [Methylobacterium sp.]
MIDTAYVTTMARYNRWQNRSLYEAADTLTDEARRQDRGAFFRSIHGTFCHLLWADQIWLSRFAGTPKPTVSHRDSAAMIADWQELKAARRDFDKTMLGWAEDLSPEWLAQDVTWTTSLTGQQMTMPAPILVMHVFNHQTHHRGQAHAMLTAAGAKPDDTDLMLVELRGK